MQLRGRLKETEGTGRRGISSPNNDSHRNQTPTAEKNGRTGSRSGEVFQMEWMRRARLEVRLEDCSWTRWDDNNRRSGLLSLWCRHDEYQIGRRQTAPEYTHSLKRELLLIAASSSLVSIYYASAPWTLTSSQWSIGDSSYVK